MSSPEEKESPETGSPKSSVNWLLPLVAILVVVILVVGGLFFAEGCPEREPYPEDPEELAPAQVLYERNCGICHGDQGQGLTRRFPPVAQTERAQGEPEELILIVLHGMQGPVEVAGNTYDTLMPAMGSRLSNAEIAAILTFIRSSFGNDASPVSSEDVAQVREAHPLRRPPWTAEELDGL